jgi:hypothetical protein
MSASGQADVVAMIAMWATRSRHPTTCLQACPNTADAEQQQHNEQHRQQQH